MATVTQVQNVANSPTNAYPVAVFKLAGGGELQALVLTDSSGVEYDALNPFPISGSFSASLAASSTSSEQRKLVDNTVGGTKLLDANANRKGGRIRVATDGAEAVIISFSGSADATGIPYAPGDLILLADGAMKWVGPVYAFCVGSSVYVDVVEFT